MHCAGVQTRSEAWILVQPDAGRRVWPWQGLSHQLHVSCGCLSEEGDFSVFMTFFLLLGIKFLFSADDLWRRGPEPAREDGGG